MEKQHVIQYWLSAATTDLKAAERLHQSGDYLHALFLGHLYLEKMIKAQIVRHTNEPAPRSEDLRALAEMTGLDLTLEQQGLLARVAEYSVKAHYPDVSLHFQRQCTHEFCAAELEQIKKFGTWIKWQL